MRKNFVPNSSLKIIGQVLLHKCSSRVIAILDANTAFFAPTYLLDYTMLKYVQGIDIFALFSIQSYIFFNVELTW